MRVVVTRGNTEISERCVTIWLTNSPETIRKRIDRIHFTEPERFKRFFGFTPRKGSKKVYNLTLKEFQKID